MDRKDHPFPFCTPAAPTTKEYTLASGWCLLITNANIPFHLTIPLLEIYPTDVFIYMQKHYDQRYALQIITNTRKNLNVY